VQSNKEIPGIIRIAESNLVGISDNIFMGFLTSIINLESENNAINGSFTNNIFLKNTGINGSSINFYVS
jgi:hypothetical protein